MLVAFLVLFLLPAGTSLALEVSAPTRGGGIDGGLPDTTNGDETFTPEGDTPADTETPATTDTTVAGASEVTSPPASTPSPAEPAATTGSPGATTAPTPAGAPPATVVTTQPGAADPAVVVTVPGAPEEVAVPGEGESQGARGARARGVRPAAGGGESTGAIQSPGLLVAGLGMVVGGAVALLVRSRRAPAEPGS